MPTTSHGVVGVDVDSNRHASMMNASHIPSSVNLPQNARISLVRNSSTGRPVWRIDHGISSLRAEVMLRRKLVYLQEQHDNTVALDTTAQVFPAIENYCNGVTIQSERNIIIKDPSSELNCLVDRMTESKLSAPAAFQHTPLHISIRYLPNENGTEKHENFIDTSSKVNNNNNIYSTTKAMSATKPQSPNEECDDAKKYLQDQMMNGELIHDTNGLVHEISKISTPSKIDQTLPPSHHHHHHHHHLPNYIIPTVQLSHSTTDNQRRITYLDFDEGNIVGKMTQQYFCIVAPTDEECNGDDGSQEFHIQLKQSLLERGIRMCYYNMTDDDVQDSTCDENNNVIAFMMKEGESKTMKMIWNPMIDGCMRERIDLMVTNQVGIHWTQSIVLVGEAHSDAVNKDEGQEDRIEVVTEDVAESNDWMVDEHNNMVSDITDTVYCYSRDEIALENSDTLYHGDEVSMGDELHHHNNHDHHHHDYDNHVLQGIKGEDDSMAYSQGTHGLLPMTDNEVTAERMTLWNVNLSAINEISDNGTRGALYPHRDFGRQFTNRAHEISVSLESGGSVLGHLEKIDETDKYMDISTIRSPEPSNCTAQIDTTAMFHSIGVFPEEPHDIGRQGYTSVAATRTQSAEDDWTKLQHISKLDKAKEPTIDFSRDAFKLEQGTGYRMEHWDEERVMTVKNEERTRIKVDQEHYRLQSKEINDFEYLLVTEGLVEGGTTLADNDASDRQIELDIDLNSSLINFTENVRPKSPSFGSLSSKDSIDDNSSFPSTKFDERPPRASLLSLSLAENLDPIDNEVEYLELQIQGEKLVRTQSSHSDVEHEPTMSFSQMMEQTSDSDNSYEAELGNTKSELNAVIDKISEMEVDLLIQHEYITSPSNLDVYTQLVNLNDHADGTTPLSINRISDPTKFFPSTKRVSQPLLNNDEPTWEASSTVKIEPAAQENDFAKQSTSLALERSESKECDFEAEHRSEHGTPNEHFKKLLPTAPAATLKTPHNSRLEKIASIRDKLSLIKIDDTLSNGSSPHDADRTKHPTVSTAVTPRGVLMVNDLPNSTKSSARKCYFYTSPARRDARTNVSPTDIDSRRKRGQECDKKDNDLHPQDMEKGQMSDKEGITTVSLSHLRPRELTAHEKHVKSIREQKNKDNSSPIPRKGRNGSSPHPPIAPSPRELKAYEKHIRSMRERLNRVGMTYSCPDVLASSGKNGSPVTRHMQGTGGVNSPIQRGRWSG